MKSQDNKGSSTEDQDYAEQGIKGPDCHEKSLNPSSGRTQADDTAGFTALRWLSTGRRAR